MRRLALAAAVMAALAGSSLPLSAQWFTYPMTGIPRDGAGKPNMNAPAPRAPDGKPDFSGVWLPDDPLPCPPFMRDGDDCIEKIPLARTAANIAADIPGGLPYQPWAATIAAQRAADGGKDDPHARCLPSNLPRLYTLPHYNKIIHMPGLLVFLQEFNGSYRQIFTDNRPLPDDPQPGWYGYSSARWDGDTLVVQSNGFRDDLWLDMRGNFMGAAARITERFTRPTFGRLDIEFTVDDPKTFTKPWSVRIKQAFAVDVELLEEICLENEKSAAKMRGN
jgi:hypothetical protein